MNFKNPLGDVKMEILIKITDLWHWFNQHFILILLLVFIIVVVCEDLAKRITKLRGYKDGRNGNKKD
jgi:hypothetical protein